jgi:hypothetical protein
MSCQIRFLDNNFSDSGTLLTYPVAQSGFPISNIHDQLRSRVCKFAGTFIIDASNNAMYFYDGGGKTISLTMGDYTAAALAAHIQTKMNASSSNWSCSHNGTRFFIDRSSGSKALTITLTTNAVWSTIGFVGTSDITIPTGGTYADETRIHTRERLIWDFGLPMPVSALCLIGPLSEVFGITAAATVTLMGNSLNDWTSPPMTEVATVTDAGVFHHTTDTGPYRFYCLEIVDRTNPGGIDAIKIGHLYLGDHIALASSNVAIGFSKTHADESSESVSESGVRYYNERTKYKTFDSMEIQQPTATERRQLEQLWHDKGLSQSFYVSLDPTLAVSAEIDELTIYCNFADQPEFRHIIRDYYTMSLSLREAI